MTKTKKALFCNKILFEFPELYKYCYQKERSREIYYFNETEKYISYTDVLVYIISRETHYPHTPDFKIFIGKSRKKYKKYIQNLDRYISENPEVTKFCLL